METGTAMAFGLGLFFGMLLGIIFIGILIFNNNDSNDDGNFDLDRRG